jgi:glycosyltransferase involved in cell wall biosynthesis
MCAVTKVSVVVPVYNPGAHIDDCLRSLLDQTMPAGDYEAIFVDDGSTDGTGERLDALAAEHPHVRVHHIPNSGWPGRPRNLGMDMAEGEYVLFVDNDDWLEREALERMYETAARDEADIVIGKVVGHGKPVPPTLFAENRTGVGIEWPPLVWLLTPHRLFRRAFLAEHGLRFPEGRRRLEDHVFVLGAHFRTNRTSVLADAPCYHWMLRSREDSASAEEFDPAMYYRNLREVLDVVDANTEPGPLRDRLYLRWYRGKVLSRVGGLLFLNRAPDARRARFAEIAELMAERFPPTLDAQLPPALQARAALVRAGAFDAIVQLAEADTQLEGRIVTREVRIAPGAVELRLEASAHDRAGLLRFERDGDGTRWTPRSTPLPDAVRDAAVAEASDVNLLLRQVGETEEFLIPATVRPRLVPLRGTGGRSRLVLDIDTTVPLGARAAGEYVLRGVIYLAGYRLSASVAPAPRAPRLVLAVDGDGGTAVRRPTVKQRIAARAPGLQRTVARAKERIRG